MIFMFEIKNSLPVYLRIKDPPRLFFPTLNFEKNFQTPSKVFPVQMWLRLTHQCRKCTFAPLYNYIYIYIYFYIYTF